jgi:hypothetical protein
LGTKDAGRRQTKQKHNIDVYESDWLSELDAL